MKRLLIFLCALFLVFGIAGMANALPFGPVTHDYGEQLGLEPYKGETYIPLAFYLPGANFVDIFYFPDVDPPAADINSAYFSIMHVGNYGSFENPELYWVTEANQEYYVGYLTASGRMLDDSEWKTDTFELSQEIIDTITSYDPWSLVIKLSESTYQWDEINVAKAVFWGDYNPVPEPTTMLLLGAGLLGLAGFRRKFRK